jgi:glycosyltransferase involved in cell wall biosynthesis
MKVIHVPYCFRPDAVGGTEVYVESLAREQQRRGLDVVVAVPSRLNSQHIDAGLPVRRFATADQCDLTALYGAGDEAASRAFATVVDQERPDVVHLHTFTSAVSAYLAHTLRERDVRLVFTYHTPTVSCARGTLLHWGRDVCDGRLDVHRCASCTLHGLGLDSAAGRLIGALPSVVGHTVGKLGLAGGPWTALRMTHLVQTRHAALRSFLADMDGIVVLCDWARDLLVRIGVAEEKLTLSRHGLAQVTPTESRNTSIGSRPHVEPLRVSFFGRLHPTKGIDTLLRALAAEPTLAVLLDVYGTGEPTYARRLYRMAADDSRVRFLPPIASHQVPSALRGYDILAVPSRWLETGPLVVLEAFAAGVPVVGSRLGGIAENVVHGVNGLLLDPDSVEAWHAALRQLTLDAELLPRLRAGVRSPRRIDAVTDDMLALYDQLLLHLSP